MFTRTKRLFQLSLITVFATLLFLGTIGINTALANHNELEGKIVLKETCDNGVGNKPSKRTIKSAMEFRFLSNTATNPTVNGDFTPFPAWTDSNFYIADFDGLGTPLILDGNEAVAPSKNGKTGTFVQSVDNVDGATQGTFVLSLSGKVKRNKDNDPQNQPGDAAKIVGKVVGYDQSTLCTYVGKFKLKRCPNNSCPNV
jgi:hypothetical protein